MDGTQTGTNMNINVTEGIQSAACYTRFESFFVFRWPQNRSQMGGWGASNLNAAFAWVPVARTEWRLMFPAAFWHVLPGLCYQ
jgi:hypothetical protein